MPMPMPMPMPMQITPFVPTKLLFHRDRLEASVQGRLVFPISVELDLSNQCPHDCPFCSFGTSKSQGYRQQNWTTFPFPRILFLLDELKECGVLSVTFTGGGEPLIHKHAAQIMWYATKAGLQWGLVTNGLLLKGSVARAVGEGATFVRVSLDAGTDETHQITHGISKPQFSTILSNLTALRLDNPTLTIGASFCVMDSNYLEVSTAAARLKALGASYLEIRPTFPTDWRGDGWVGGLSDVNYEPALHEVEAARARYSDAQFKVIGMIERFEALRGYKKGYDRCRIGPLTTVIGADARIWHCCVQRGQPAFELGSVATTPFRTAWEAVHRYDMSKRIDVDQCPRCRYDGFNRLLADAVITDGMHRNFI